MTVSIDKVDLIRERANVSYEEAKDALEKSSGDIVEALIYLEKDEKIRKERISIGRRVNESTFGQRIKDFVKEIHSHSFIIEKNAESIINIPSTIALLLLLFAFPMTVIALFAAILMGCKVVIKKKNGAKLDLKKKIDEAFENEEKNKSE
ncbi:protein of unknown function [Peptoclostridium litorale DSM 5388]|uniref:DUF4342 domain-containing protein n=1 Tax=Peptoclostridium litorale DSM 5388 TaxID=1121324 RepID=A0A069RKP1_PEPLI|nr:DUF4342 domain-containing protein [Peptoclostridium litorale]KDR96690.1 hypothetical protein CLIT_2c02960 [Peptoclostridium litorale DSM 5388]SIN67700.1 protein of unknown function [Peptoclostridium litorale DSM 5388]